MFLKLSKQVQKAALMHPTFMCTRRSFVFVIVQQCKSKHFIPLQMDLSQYFIVNKGQDPNFQQKKLEEISNWQHLFLSSSFRLNVTSSIAKFWNPTCQIWVRAATGGGENPVQFCVITKTCVLVFRLCLKKENKKPPGGIEYQNALTCNNFVVYVALQR